MVWITPAAVVSVTGFMVVGLALLGTAGFYFWTRDVQALIGLGFCGSLYFYLCPSGGGICKAADVGRLGKAEAGIPEDDPPAVIADNVEILSRPCRYGGGFVETYVVTTIATIYGYLLMPGNETVLVSISL